MRITELKERLEKLGAKPEHEAPLLRTWTAGRPLDTRAAGRRQAEHFFPRPLLRALPELNAELGALARVTSEHRDSEGSSRLLIQLTDGETIEAVTLPREGVCVSTQVGCAVGCAFCMTGRSGLIRQLTSGEIVAQVALARARQPVRKVVFMGMGEPSHNLPNVLEAIELLGTLGGIAHKQLVFSTVGDHRVFERLPAGRVKPALALSLHTTRAELRAQLLPRAPRIDPAELVELCERYARATSYPIQYQWTLLEGINDSEEELEALARLLKGKYAVLNFIPYNSVPELAFKRPDWERARALARQLHRQGILTKLRHSAGQEVDGGCGQLRARRAVAAK